MQTRFQHIGPHFRNRQPLVRIAIGPGFDLGGKEELTGARLIDDKTARDFITLLPMTG
jgi:hypothetical protein